MLDISIIILTFNSIQFVNSCLDSVFSQNYQDFEVIVVDNGSSDNTVDFVRKHYPQVKLIENRGNVGATRARNQGLEIAEGKWVLSLDCDVILERDFFAKVLKVIKDLPPDIGMIQPKILMTDKKTIYSCGIYLSQILRRFFDIGKGKLNNGQFNLSKHIFGACSACALYKKEMLESIKEDTGYFDERFFFLVEDVDLSWRAQKKGWKALYIPEATCYHYGNSSGFDRRFRQYLCFRNRYYSIIKNEGLKNYYKKIFPALIYDLPRFIFLMIKYKKDNIPKSK